MDPLLDNEFLKELFSQRYRETYARVISLNIDEEPLEEIQGRITQGSVNLDGNSSLRRTSNLSFACNYDTSITDYYWTLNSKYKLLLGLKNTINSNYPEIIWFKLGTYVITSFSYNYSTSGMSISISGKDKMCLINGDVGGEIYASVDFGTREEIDDEGNKELVDIQIEDIIREAVHEYGHEPWERIIIKDIPKYGLFLLEWQGDKPMYALISTDGSDEAANVYISQSATVFIDGASTPISEVPVYLSTNELNLVNKEDYTVVTTGGDKTYYVCKINPGQSAGYDVTELTYPRNGEESGLITSVGDSVTSVLDKIVDFLGNYEYFFDVDGNFIFQKKDKWIDTNWNVNDFDTVSMGNDYTLLSYLPTSWLFEGSELIVDFNNSPNIGNIKNDYAIWGERQSGDNTIPIHMRYAVDKKPVYYKSISVSHEELEAYKKLYPEFANGFKDIDSNGNWPSYVYCTEDCPQEYRPVGVEVREEDWRELIYQMALDYRRFNHFDTFNTRVLENNIVPKADGTFEVLYPKGITGYEQYYVDLEGFWRYLYRPEYDSSMNVGYSIKSVDELDLNEDIFIRDHWYNVTDKILGDNYEEFYVTYVGEDKSTAERLLVENPKRVSPKLWFEKNCQVWERLQLSNSWETGNWLHRPSQFKQTSEIYYDDGNKEFYYDNGAPLDNRQDENGNLISPTAQVSQYRTNKYNLLINYREDITEGQLLNVCGIGITSDNIDFDKFNTYTIYKVDENKYYILECNSIGQSQEYSQDCAGWIMRRVKMPVITGVQYYDSEDYVYRFNPDRTIYSKVGVLNILPSTFTYLNFYSIPSEEMDRYSTAHVWEEFKNKPYFNFKEDDSFEKSALYRSTTNNKYTNLAEEKSYVQSNFKYGENNYYSNYTYIKQNLYGVPVVDDNEDYMYTHLPIAYYQNTYYYDYTEGYTGRWNTLVKESPELLIFWFDFLDSQASEIGKYGVNNVMDRSKASNESNVKAIYYRDTLNIVYQRTSKADDKRQNKLIDYTRSGYNIMQCGEWVYDYFKVANCGKSCKDVLDQWLYQYTQANESVSISCIPIYTLEPNNRISVHDDNIKINGEYIINSISIPLTFNGTMSINATKAVDKLQ